MLTQERLKELLYYDPETGVFTWLKYRNNPTKTGLIAGTAGTNGYILISVDNKRYKAHRLAWLYVHGKFPDDQIDHINRNTSDNRISNLRPATNRENCQNRSKSCANTSGIKGVSWSKKTGKWRADIGFGGELFYLGLFDSVEDAKAARDSAKKEYHKFSPKD